MAKLKDDELELWHAWKQASDAVSLRIARELTEGTGLSAADFGVLSRLEELGKGELRQHALAESMGWDKSRLSHHLSRMDERKLIKRKTNGVSDVVVALTSAGQKALDDARPVHSKAVREQLLQHLPKKRRSQLLEIFRALAT